MTTGRFRDSIANLVGDALTDVRQSVVEEGWFGRQTTDRDRDTDFDRLWRPAHDTPEAPEKDKGVDIDR